MGMGTFFLLRLQRASLFIHPYPERCSGLYSYWGFAPSLRLTLVAAQYLGRCSCYGFTSQLFKCNLPNYLQLRPVLARNICCTLCYTSCLGLRSAIVRKPNCYTILWRRYYLQSYLLHFNKYGRLHISRYGLLHISKDGLKAQKEYSPEQRSGYSWLSILRSERAKGRRKCVDCIQFCWCMGMGSFFLLRLQRAS